MNSSMRPEIAFAVSASPRPVKTVWSAVKELLCTNHHEVVTTSTDADASFCSMLAVFFVNKVRNIKVAISAALTSQQFDPLSSDQPFSGDLMSKFS